MFPARLAQSFPDGQRSPKNSVSIQRSPNPSHLPISLKRIKQPNGTSCGIACAATLAHVPYRRAVAAAYKAFEKEEWTTFRTHICDLREVLKQLKLRLGRKVACSDWSRVPDGVLVAINYHEKKDVWHWVVHIIKDGEPRVIDPRTKRPYRTDFNTMRLAWYHHVRPLRSTRKTTA